MNAQEAIEHMEQYLKELDTLISHHKAHDIEMLGGDHFPDSVKKRHKQLDDKRESFTIALESTKVLHEKVIPAYTSDYEDIGMTDPSSFYGTPLRELGIEKEDTE